MIERMQHITIFRMNKKHSNRYDEPSGEMESLNPSISSYPNHDSLILWNSSDS